MATFFHGVKPAQNPQDPVVYYSVSREKSKLNDRKVYLYSLQVYVKHDRNAHKKLPMADQMQ
jgi:hypothetical protein